MKLSDKDKQLVKYALNVLEQHIFTIDNPTFEDNQDIKDIKVLRIKLYK